jgi:hypothetical protein
MLKKIKLNLDRNGTKYQLNMDDQMFLLQDNVIINTIAMKKLGIKVGELVVTFRKE